MDFVLVFLKEPKKYVVVPENFIFDLDQQKLKNNGANRNQNFKIFWSNDINCTAPNFDAEESKIHPPIVVEACYIGRVYKFYSEYYFCFFLVFLKFHFVHVKCIILFRKLHRCREQTRYHAKLQATNIQCRPRE